MSKLFRTHKDAVTEYIQHNSIHRVDEKTVLKDFAKWLDGFQVATKDIEIMALQTSRKIDREMMSRMIDKIGVKEAEKIALEISAKHRHYSQWQDKAKTTEGWISKRFTVYAWVMWKIRKIVPRAWQLTMPTDVLPDNIKDDLDKIKAAQK